VSLFCGVSEFGVRFVESGDLGDFGTPRLLTWEVGFTLADIVSCESRVRSALIELVRPKARTTNQPAFQLRPL